MGILRPFSFGIVQYRISPFFNGLERLIALFYGLFNLNLRLSLPLAVQIASGLYFDAYERGQIVVRVELVMVW